MRAVFLCFLVDHLPQVLLLFADATQSVVISDDLLSATTSTLLHASVPGGNNTQSQPQPPQPRSKPPPQSQPQQPQQPQSPNTTPQQITPPITQSQPADPPLLTVNNNKTATANNKTATTDEKTATMGVVKVTTGAPPVVPTTSANTADGAYKSELATNKLGTRAPVAEATTTGTPSVDTTTTTSEDLLPMPDVIYDGDNIDFDEIQTAPVKGKKLHTRTHPHRCGISIHSHIRMHLTNPRTHYALGAAETN